MRRRTHRTERKLLKLLLAAFGGLVLLMAVGFGVYKIYHRWEGHRLVTRAEAFLEAGDIRSAALTAHRAFQMSHSNAEACRILARIAEQTGQAAAIEWRKMALAAAPDSIEDQIALALAALRFDQIPLAESTLAKLDPAPQEFPAYHQAEAQLAMTRKDSAIAEKHFAEAVRLDPSNKMYQFDLAVLRLRSVSDETRATAAKLLQGFLDDKVFRAPAARALRDGAAQRRDGPAFLEMAASLSSYPEATFRDRILYAKALHVTNHPDFANKLTELQNEAVGDSTKLAELVAWMGADNLALLAISWIKGLPKEVVERRPVPVPVADCFIATKDWSGLREWCSKTNWGDLEFFRHAYLSRYHREQNDMLASRSEWNIALQKAGSDGERLHALEQGVAKWGWKKEAEDLLWKLAGDQDRQSGALVALYQYYLDTGDTPNLYRVVARLCDLRANDQDAQNNLVHLSLLLNVDTGHAHDSAARLHKKDPNNPVFASTYAFSLYRRGRFQDAVKVMNNLKPEELENPALATYYAIFLAAAGDKAKASQYLEPSSRATLLPEEKALLESAESKLNQ